MSDLDGPQVAATASTTELLHRDVTGIVLAEFFHLYDDLGHGFLEAVYVKGLALYLADAGVHIEREVQFNVRLRGQVIGRYRADLVVESTVVVEVKAAPRIRRRDVAQLLNYLRVSGLEVGLILNFGPVPSFERQVASNQRATPLDRQRKR